MTALAAWLEEALAPLGVVRVRAMFGGHGVSLDGLSIGLLADGLLYLKCDAQTLPRFEAEGLEPFVYEKDGRLLAMSYRQAPDAAMDDAEVLREWVAIALEAARRARRPAPRRPPRGHARSW